MCPIDETDERGFRAETVETKPVGIDARRSFRPDPEANRSAAISAVVSSFNEANWTRVSRFIGEVIGCKQRLWMGLGVFWRSRQRGCKGWAGAWPSPMVNRRRIAGPGGTLTWIRCMPRSFPSAR